MLPNVYVHAAWGKLLFAACDLLAGHVLFEILRLRGLPEDSKLSYRIEVVSVGDGLLMHLLFIPIGAAWYTRYGCL